MVGVFIQRFVDRFYHNRLLWLLPVIVDENLKKSIVNSVERDDSGDVCSLETHIFMADRVCKHHWDNVLLLYKLMTVFGENFSVPSVEMECVGERTRGERICVNGYGSNDRLLEIEFFSFIHFSFTIYNTIEYRKAIDRISAKHKSHYEIFVLRSANVIRSIV